MESIQIQKLLEITLEQTRPGIVEVGVYKVSQELTRIFANIEAMIYRNQDLSTDKQEKLRSLLKVWTWLLLCMKRAMARRM